MTNKLERILLDANAILNGTFVSDSWSKTGIEKLLQNGSDILIGESIYIEALKVACKIRNKLGLSRDPKPFIDRYIDNIGAKRFPSLVNSYQSKIVPRHDHHVVQDAINSEATILTSDAKLWQGCRKSGINVLFPIEVFELLDGLSLKTTFFGVNPGSNAGSIYSRVRPGLWATQKNNCEFTVADFEGRLRIYYCSNDQAWKVDIPEIGSLSIPSSIQSDQFYALSLSWEVKKYLRFRISNLEHPVELEMKKPLRENLDGIKHLGRDTSGSNCWNGHVRYFVINDRPLGSNTWKILEEHPQLTPNPYDNDRLNQYMKQILI